MRTSKELLPIIQAFADGKQVQYKFHEEWANCEYPAFDQKTEYRIKPEPREFWLNIYESGSIYTHLTEKSAVEGVRASGAKLKTIRVREILTDETP